jgi:hypothetical protein
MEAHDFPEYNDACAGVSAGIHNLAELALHLRGRLGHARRAHDMA